MPKHVKVEKALLKIIRRQSKVMARQSAKIIMLEAQIRNERMREQIDGAR